MLGHDFRSEAGYWVHKTARRFERAINAEVASEGLTYRQCQVLGWLALDGDLAQCELSDRMNVEPPTLVRALDRMERDGLIVREPCADDRRRKVIRPTEKAIPVWNRIVNCANRVRDRSVHGMSTDEIGTLRNLLKRVHTNLGGDDFSVSSSLCALNQEIPAETDRRGAPKTSEASQDRAGVSTR